MVRLVTWEAIAPIMTSLWWCSSSVSAELLMALETLGMGATLPGGFFLNRFGIRWGSLVALILPTAAHLLIWTACNHVTYYSEHYWLLALYFFLAGELSLGKCRLIIYPEYFRKPQWFFNGAAGNMQGNLAGTDGGVAVILICNFKTWFENDIWSTPGTSLVIIQRVKD